MFGMKGKPDQTAPVAANVMAPPAPRPRVEPAAPGAPPRPDTICSVSTGTSILGNIVCDGPAQFHGHVEGEVRGSELLIGEGAQVVGNVVAQEVIIRGRIKGTIRAVRVKLQAGGAVEGDIFHRSLSIEDSALFEGSSRRVEKPLDTAATSPDPPVARPQVAAADGT